jgi:hypothetical protein
MAEQFRDFDPSRVDTHWPSRFDDYRTGRDQTPVTHEELYWLSGDIASVRELQQGIVPQEPEDDFQLNGTDGYTFYLQKGVYVPSQNAVDVYDPNLIQVVALQDGENQDSRHSVEYRLYRPDLERGRDRFGMDRRSTVNRDPLGLEFIEPPFAPVEDVVVGPIRSFNFYWGIVLLTSHQKTPPEKRYRPSVQPPTAA